MNIQPGDHVLILGGPRRGTWGVVHAVSTLLAIVAPRPFVIDGASREWIEDLQFQYRFYQLDSILENES